LLDEGKKQYLESVLDQIEKGTADKEMLLGLDFLKLKKRPHIVNMNDLCNSFRRKKSKMLFTQTMTTKKTNLNP
jgi:hypothetical protein